MNMGAIAMDLFGNYYRKRRTRFSYLTNDLVKARMYITIEKFLSTSTLYALIFASVCVILGVAACALLGIKPLAFILIIFVGIICYLSLFLLLTLYPRVKSWERKGKIDGHLPYAISWMSFMATTGVIPYLIFRKLAEREEYFGEVSREANLVVKDVELLGFDFISALRDLASVTPSTPLRVFLQGAVTNALSGGEMGTYFVSKAREGMEDNRKKFTEFIATLGLISEVYIIALVAAPLLIVVMFAAMMMLGGASPMILMAIIYGYIPVGSLMFLLLTDMLTPEGIKKIA
jgi:archaeal flagellar protein FlaJ